MTRAAQTPPRQQPPRPVVTQQPPTATAGQCDSPTTPGYNLNGLCFDTRPVLQDVFVQVPPGVEGTPSPSTIWVLVGADGRAQVVRGAQISSNPQFHLAALNHARSVLYKPAEKGGTPVAAWSQFRFPPKR
jgi:hypothetical protein